MESHQNGLRCPGQPDPASRRALQPAVDFIMQKTDVSPTIGIICGSGLGELAQLVKSSVAIPYTDIPGFPVSTAPGHSGRLVFGTLSGASVVLMQGRLHVYEGHLLWRVTMGVRVMKMLGVTHIIVTNAVGGLNPDYQVGDIMIVKDHINMFGLAGESPLRGPNDESFGPRFFSINSLYKRVLRDLAKEAAIQVGIEDTVREGILTISGGPNYESVAELKMFHLLGVDCVGMSSIPECLVAHHCGIEVLAFCLVTNQCHLDMENHQSAAPNHQEVLDAAEAKKSDLKRFVSVLVEKINNYKEADKLNGINGVINGIDNVMREQNRTEHVSKEANGIDNNVVRDQNGTEHVSKESCIVDVVGKRHSKLDR